MKIRLQRKVRWGTTEFQANECIYLVSVPLYSFGFVNRMKTRILNQSKLKS